jgi:hypothetical protein
VNEDPHPANQSKNILPNVEVPIQTPIQTHEEIEGSQDGAVRAVEQQEIDGKREVSHVRIDRERVRADIPRRSSSHPDADAAPTTTTHLPYDEGGIGVDNSDGKHVQPSVDVQPDLHADSEEPSNHSAKPDLGRQHSLLDRLAPGPKRGSAAAGDDVYGDHGGGDRGRGRRGRRSGRAPRR